MLHYYSQTFLTSNSYFLAYTFSFSISLLLSRAMERSNITFLDFLLFCSGKTYICPPSPSLPQAHKMRQLHSFSRPAPSLNSSSRLLCSPLIFSVSPTCYSLLIISSQAKSTFNCFLYQNASKQTKPKPKPPPPPPLPLCPLLFLTLPFTLFL